MDFEFPIALLLMLFIPLLLVLKRRTRQRLPYADVGGWVATGRRPAWQRHYDEIIYVLVSLSVVMGLANLSYSEALTENFFESKWIFVALDMSGSMKRPISMYSDKSIGDAAIEGVETFIDMRGQEDYIGIVGFSSYAKLVAPLTFDRNLLQKKLDLLKKENQTSLYRELGAGGGTNVSEAVWLSLSALFAMLPEENRLSSQELAGLRTMLLGPPGVVPEVPARLRGSGFGRGMAVILFTDGRIEPALRAGGRGGGPNLVNLIELMKLVGIKLYIISVGGDVDAAVADVMEKSGTAALGRIFVTAKDVDRETIREVYSEIDRLEKNRNLARITRVKKSTRQHFAGLAFILMSGHLLLRNTPGFRKL
jgi:hypothetical protein